MKTKLIISLLVVNGLFFSSIAHAELDLKWSELRLFISGNTYEKDQTQLNTLTDVDNIEKLKSFAGLGFEAVADYKPWVKLGTRLKFIGNSNYPVGSRASYLQILQYTAGIVARFPIAATNNVSMDLLAELGLANTKIDIQTLAGKATFNQSAGFFQRAGASLGLGGEEFKFYVEGGYEWQNLNGLKSEGTLVNNISKVDLSGPYTAVGVIISGLPEWIKPGKLFTVGGK